MPIECTGGELRRYKSGTGFLMSKEIMNEVIDWKPMNDPLCALRNRCKYNNITLINVHAAPAEKGIEIKEGNYRRP